MIWRGRQKILVTMSIACALGLFSSANSVKAQVYIGLRGGTSLDDCAGYFRQTEVFSGIDLPWQWEPGFNWSLTPRIEASAGWLSGGSKDGFIGTLGPAMELRKGRFPLTLEGGASPTFISRYKYGEKDFGGRFQFTDHIGLNLYVSEHLVIGLRFQHMSNAGIYRGNPGVNIEGLTTSYSF